jgi:hypothetical protein
MAYREDVSTLKLNDTNKYLYIPYDIHKGIVQYSYIILYVYEYCCRQVQAIP